MTQQFKVGDIVRLISVRESWPCKVGDTCTVKEDSYEGSESMTAISLRMSGTYMRVFARRLRYASIFYAETDKKGLVI